MDTYLIHATRSVMVRGDWDSVPFYLVVDATGVNSYPHTQRPEFAGPYVEWRNELSVHRDMLEVNAGLRDFRAYDRAAFDRLATAFPVRPDQIKMLGEAA